MSNFRSFSVLVENCEEVFLSTYTIIKDVKYNSIIIRIISITTLLLAIWFHPYQEYLEC